MDEVVALVLGCSIYLDKAIDQGALFGCQEELVTTTELDPVSHRPHMYIEALRGSAWGGEEAVLYETEGEEHMYYFQKVAREVTAYEMEGKEHINCNHNDELAADGTRPWIILTNL